MNYQLLLVNGYGEAVTTPLLIRTLRQFPGPQALSVHFRPVRSDLLFESANEAGRLAYRILAGEGIVRGQLWVEYQVLGEPINVIGRSSDLAFALALITSTWPKSTGAFDSLTGTGIVDSEGNVKSVERALEKVVAAVKSVGPQSGTVIFYPAPDAAAIEAWRVANQVSEGIHLIAVAHIEDALSHLGYTLEKVYLRNPFRGLGYFDCLDHSIFFGRDVETREVVKQLLRREALGAPGLLVEGASGSGKSSFMRAGILPTLFNPRSQSEAVQQALGERPISAEASRIIWRPGLLPVGADEQRILREIRNCWGAMSVFCESNRVVTSETVETLAEWRHEQWPSTHRFVWLIDQFEELFNLRLDDSTIETFGRLLSRIQQDGVWVLASIRADAMPRLKEYESFRKVFGANEGHYYLASLDGPALDDVISRPALAANLVFAVNADGHSLEQRLREDAYHERNSLPLLQFTLNELYLRRSGNLLTFDAYEALGGVRGSIGTAAEKVLDANPEYQKVVPRLLRNLISVDDAGGVSRRYAPLPEIVADHMQYRLLSDLLDARLCVSDLREGQPVAAFAHDTLITTLPALTNWLQQESGLLQTRDLAQRESELWRRHGRSDRWLAADDKVLVFHALQATDIVLPVIVQEFIDRSWRRSMRGRLVKRVGVVLMALLALLATGASLVASKKRAEAENQVHLTRVAQSRVLTQVASAALQQGDVPFSQAVILELLKKASPGNWPDAAAVNVFQEARAQDSVLTLLSGHTHEVHAASFSPDATRIVTASYDGTARVWDSETGVQLAILAGHSDLVMSAVFSPDASKILTGSTDGTARIWDAHSGALVLKLMGHKGSVRTAEFSPDGRRVVTASADETVRIWDTETATPLLIMGGHGGVLWSASYSVDGLRVVSASEDGTATIWNAINGVPVMVLKGHIKGVLSARYSPDGSRIATTGRDGTARLWDARTGTAVLRFPEQESDVRSANFSPDGSRLLTTSLDGTTRIWDALTAAPIKVLRGHSGIVWNASYSPKGDRIVTASWDNTARIWNAHEGRNALILSGHKEGVNSVDYSSGGDQIATASEDKTVRVWNANTGAQTLVLLGHSAEVHNAKFSPDASQILSSSDDETARLWDSRLGTPLLTINGHPDKFFYASYAPDGSQIVASLGESLQVGVWNVHTGARLLLLSGHKDHVHRVVYSPDGARIVTASEDGTVRIWDSHTGSQLTVMSRVNELDDSVAAYSADGLRLVTAGENKTASAWDAVTGRKTLVLSGHKAAVNSAEFSPDGRYIVTGSSDNTVRIWDADNGTQLEVLLGHTRHVLSVAYSPDGRHIASASADKTARIWDATVQAGLNSQIVWARAAEVDGLSGLQRSELGLQVDERVKSWPVDTSECDQATAAIYDQNRKSQGVDPANINSDIGNAACSRQIQQGDHSPRIIFQSGRAEKAKGDVQAAQRDFERAVAQGYAPAKIDLADLLSDQALGALDRTRALSLYRQAWDEGVAIAAYRLGKIYEEGLLSLDSGAKDGVAADRTNSWTWYQKGAEVEEPNSLARLGSRDEGLALTRSLHKERNALLLSAFHYYALAAERARIDDWPDHVWSNWRYRRATLARFLAREGLMQQVADAYSTIRPP